MSMETNGASSATHALVEATERLCDLPGIATQNWCDRAASAIALLTTGPVVVAIGELNGTALRVEAYGIASRTGVPADTTRALHARFRDIAPLDWGVCEPSEWNARVQTATCECLQDEDYARSKSAAQWRDAGAHGVIASAARYAPKDERRVVLVEVGATGSKADWFPSILKLSVDAAMGPSCVARDGSATSRSCPRMLTSREQEILDLLALGLSVRVIADELGAATRSTTM